ETMLEGAQGQLRAEARRAREDLVTRKGMMEQLEAQAEGLMYELRQAWSPVGWPEAADTVEDEEIELPASLESPGSDEDSEPVGGEEPAEESAGRAAQEGTAGGLSQADRLAA